MNRSYDNVNDNYYVQVERRERKSLTDMLKELYLKKENKQSNQTIRRVPRVYNNLNLLPDLIDQDEYKYN